MLRVLLAIPALLAPPQDPLEELADWTDRFAAGRVDWSGRAETGLERLVRGVRKLGDGDPSRAAEVDAALLDLAGHGLRPHEPLPGSATGATPAERTRRVGAKALRRVVEGDRGEERLRRILRDVLLVESGQPTGRRLAALELVAEARPAEGSMALLAVAQDGDDPVRHATLWVMCAWPDPLLDRYLVDGLGRPFDRARDPHPFALVSQRIALGGAPLDDAAAEHLSRRAAVMLLDPDWREASRAIELSRGMSAPLAVPMLIEALAAWGRREELGNGSRRIQHEILTALQRLSGRTIGHHPDRWWTWWSAVQSGQVELAAADSVPPASRSSAAFFGLRLVSDRVTFVIDRSGSMAAPWKTTGRTRYEEAVDQLVSFLQASGPETRFNVVLFGSESILSSHSLVKAVPDNVDRARRSLLSREPDGGTELRPAVDLALAVGADRRPDLDALQADTVVVLCDGRTQRGQGWVPQFLAGPNAEARVMFHCVLLASEGDGTLEALASGTGGDFLRVGG